MGAEGSHSSYVTIAVRPAERRCPVPAKPKKAYLKEIPLDRIAMAEGQPRQTFSESYIAELAEDIKQIGLLQPVLLIPSSQGHFDLVVGENRFRAHQLLKW